MSYKPDGYTDLSPYLCVADPEAAEAFCVAVFGAEPLRAIPSGGGRTHREIRIGDSVVMLGSAEVRSAMLHLYLPDPDAAFARAVEAGAEVIQEMTEAGDGDRRGGVRSPDGTEWWLATQL